MLRLTSVFQTQFETKTDQAKVKVILALKLNQT